MKTIKERAEAFAIRISPYPQDKGATFDTDTKRAYIKGATEQKAIDIEKACEAHCRLCDKYARCEHTAWGHENVKCNEREIIRKAMED